MEAQKKTRLKRIASLWPLKNKKGLQGNLDLGPMGKVRVVLLQNNKKTEARQPTHYLYSDTGEEVKEKFVVKTERLRDDAY